MSPRTSVPACPCVCVSARVRVHCTLSLSRELLIDGLAHALFISAAVANCRGPIRYFGCHQMGRCLTLKVKFASFHVAQRSVTLPTATADPDTAFAALNPIMARELMVRVSVCVCVRVHVCVSVCVCVCV